MAISGLRSQVSLRNYNGRPLREQLRACSDILSVALSGRLHQSLQPSFTALSSRTIFMLRKIRLPFINKTHAWTVRCLIFMGKKLASFCEPQFGRISPNISLSDSTFETKKFQAKALNSTCRTMLVYKLSQNVNFDGFLTLTVLHFWQL